MWDRIDSTLSYTPKHLQPSDLADCFASDSSEYRTNSVIIVLSILCIKLSIVFGIFAFLTVT